MTEYIFFGLLLIVYILNFIERRDLYNRIMCRNINEYKTGSEKKKSSGILSAHERALAKWRKRGDINES